MPLPLVTVGAPAEPTRTWNRGTLEPWNRNYSLVQMFLGSMVLAFRSAAQEGFSGGATGSAHTVPDSLAGSTALLVSVTAFVPKV